MEGGGGRGVCRCHRNTLSSLPSQRGTTTSCLGAIKLCGWREFKWREPNGLAFENLPLRLSTPRGSWADIHFRTTKTITLEKKEMKRQTWQELLNFPCGLTPAQLRFPNTCHRHRSYSPQSDAKYYLTGAHADHFSPQAVQWGIPAGLRFNELCRLQCGK